MRSVAECRRARQFQVEALPVSRDKSLPIEMPPPMPTYRPMMDVNCHFVRPLSGNTNYSAQLQWRSGTDFKDLKNPPVRQGSMMYAVCTSLLRPEELENLRRASRPWTVNPYQHPQQRERPSSSAVARNCSSQFQSAMARRLRSRLLLRQAVQEEPHPNFVTVYD